MEKYEKELEELEKTFANCPLTFLRSLSFRLECHILDRDTGYQQYIQEMMERQSVTLKIVK
jgi:hypothetical protein